MYKTIAVTLIIICMIISILIPGCTEGGKETGPVKIAVIGFESGPVKPLGDRQYVGAMLAEKHINAAGGILGGRMIEVISYDEGYTAETTLTSINQAVADGCSAFAGFVDASQAYPGLEAIKRLDMPLYVSMAGIEKAVVPGNYYALFRSGHNTKHAEGSLWRTLNRKGYKSVVTLRWKGDYCMHGQAWFDYYSETENFSLKRIGEVWFEPAPTDITPQISKAVDYDPELVFIDVFAATVLYPAINRLRELNYQGDVVTAWTSLNDGHIVTTDPDLSEGIISCIGFLADPEIPESVEFNEAYLSMGEELNMPGAPGDYGVASYNAVISLAMAMDKAGTTKDTKKIAKAVRNLDWVTPRGNKFQVLECGNEYNPYAYIVQVRNGKTTILERVKLSPDDFGEPYTISK